MITKTVTSLAFAAGCVLALGATAQAQQNPQYIGQPQINMGQPQPMAQQHHMGQPHMMGQPYMGEPQRPMATRMVSNAPQPSRGDLGGWSARRNNIQSARYDQLLQTNMGFRSARMKKECGPINDPQLRGQCLASFQQYEPVMTGSSIPSRHWHHNRNAGY